MAYKFNVGGKDGWVECIPAYLGNREDPNPAKCRIRPMSYGMMLRFLRVQNETRKALAKERGPLPEGIDLTQDSEFGIEFLVRNGEFVSDLVIGHSKDYVGFEQAGKACQTPQEVLEFCPMPLVGEIMTTILSVSQLTEEESKKSVPPSDGPSEPTSPTDGTPTSGSADVAVS